MCICINKITALRYVYYVFALTCMAVLSCGPQKENPNLPSASQFPSDTSSGLSQNPTVQLSEQILSEITAHYRQAYGKNARLELINSDSIIEMTFYSIPNDTDTYEGVLIAISITKTDKSTSIIRGDINGDKRDDLIISVPTEGGGGGGNIAWSDHFLFLGTTDKNYTLADVKSDGELTGCGGGYFTPETIVLNTLVGTSLCYADDDGHCCPSLKFQSTSVFVNGKIAFSTKKSLD